MARYASAVTFTTNMMKEFYLSRFLKLRSGRCHVIYNGFDDDDFPKISATACHNVKVRMLHAGGLDVCLRNPIPFLLAVQDLMGRRSIASTELCVELLGPGEYFEGQHFQSWLEQHSLQDVVTVTARIPYYSALKKLGEADILLLFQNHPAINMQVPAKLFEYMRIRKPVLAIAPRGSETARLIGETGCGYVVDCEDAEHFSESVAACIDQALLTSARSEGCVAIRNLDEFSRRHQARKLSEVLYGVERESSMRF